MPALRSTRRAPSRTPTPCQANSARPSTEDPATLAGYPAEVAQAIVASCRYGVVLGEPEDHYEETNSAGWDLAADILAAVGDLTGDHSTKRINPAFPGHWERVPTRGASRRYC